MKNWIKNHNNLWNWIIPILIGALVRIIVLLYSHHTMIWDELSFQSLAQSIAVNGINGTMPFWPPGWPYLIAFLYTVFRTNDPQLILWFNVILSIFALVIFRLLAERLFSKKISIIATWLMAIMPSYSLANTLLIYEVWMQFLLILTIYLAAGKNWSWKRTALITFLCGVLSLIRPTFIIFPLFIWIMDCVLGIRVKWTHYITVQVGTLLLITPWIIFASLTSGRFVPIALQGGLHLWMANNPNATGTHVDPPSEYWDPANSSKAQDAAIAYILENPQHLVTILPAKIWYMFRAEAWTLWFFFSTDPPVAQSTSSRITVISDIYYYFVLALSITGIIISVIKKWWRSLGALVLFLLYIATQIALFTGQLKYRWPMQFILIMYAALALWWIISIGPKKRIV